MLESNVLTRAYDIWLKSTAFALLQSIFRVFSTAFKNSRIVHIFVRESRLEPIYESSVLARILKFVFDLIYRLIAWVAAPFKRAVDGSAFAALCRRYVKSSFLCSYETLLGGFIFLMFAIPHAYWSNTYALLGVIALAGAYFFLVGIGARKPFYIHQMGFPVMLFAIACVLGVLVAIDRGDAFRVFLFYVTALLFFYLISADVTTEERMTRLLFLIYAAVIFTSLFAILQRFIGVEASASLTDLDANEGLPGRVYSTLDNPNNYAEFLVMMTPAAAVFAARYKGSKFLRFCFLCGMVFPFLALLMTYSRGCWISMVLACVVFIYYANKKLLPAFILICVAAVPFLPNSVLMRIMTIFNGGDSSTSFRLYIWDGTIKMVRDFGLTGIGLGPESFAAIYPDYAHKLAHKGVVHSHMVYMELILEMGVLGFISFMWFMLRLWKDSAVSLLSAKGKLVRLVLIACLSGLVGIALAFSVEYVWYYPRTFFAYFILAGIAAAGIRMERSEKQNEEIQ